MLHGVQYRGEPHVVGISKELLDNGTIYVQKEWVKINPELGSAVLQNAAIFALYDNQNVAGDEQKNLVSEVKRMLVEDFTKYWMMTSSRVAYVGKTCSGQQKLDAVVH